MEFSRGRTFLFRVPEGEDLLEFVNRFAEAKEIKTGVVSAIGSLKDPKIGYFDEDINDYQIIELEGTFEMVSLVGNVSLRNEKPFAHIHVALGDGEGRLYGGHLFEGKVFVAEVLSRSLRVAHSRERRGKTD